MRESEADSVQKESISAVCAACFHTVPDCPPESVSGGFLHTVYRVTAGGQTYAVKQLNPAIMARPEALGNMRRSEAIARALSPIVPAVCAILWDDDPVWTQDGSYYMCYPWVAGTSVYPPDITAAHCRQIGDLLGRIHTAEIRIKGSSPAPEDGAMEDWQALMDLSHETAWEEALGALLPRCIRWENAMHEARLQPVTPPVYSHRDLDPKNVLWQDGSPLLIDWEAAGRIDPDQELIAVLRYWACDGDGRPQEALARALLEAYRVHRDTRHIDWPQVLAASYGDWMGWLAYNIRRAADVEVGTPSEQALGAAQAAETVRTLQAYAATEKALEAILTE